MQRWLCLALDWPQRGLLVARWCRQESGCVDRRAEPGRSGRCIYILCAARPSTAAFSRRRDTAACCAKEAPRRAASGLTRPRSGIRGRSRKRPSRLCGRRLHPENRDISALNLSKRRRYSLPHLIIILIEIFDRVGVNLQTTGYGERILGFIGIFCHVFCRIYHAQA